jgi:hypothetical protein
LLDPLFSEPKTILNNITITPSPKGVLRSIHQKTLDTMFMLCNYFWWTFISYLLCDDLFWVIFIDPNEDLSIIEDDKLVLIAIPVLSLWLVNKVDLFLVFCV